MSNQTLVKLETVYGTNLYGLFGKRIFKNRPST